LLAYLDDTLEPTQARLIGQKVAESDAAQELIARIKQVTRRRRLTTPPSGPGAKTDANIIAEYLDNTLSSEQLAEVEEICLASDVHLAEIAACHQILTLVLGEPALVPPTSRQRMYGLVKGPEAIPFRRPPGIVESVDGHDDGHEADEPLRMGLPAYSGRGGLGHRLAMVGGGLALVALLAFAVWQVLPPPPRQLGDKGLKASADKKTDGPKPKRSADGAPPRDKTPDKSVRDGKVSADGAALDKDKKGKDKRTKDLAKTDDGKKDGGKSNTDKPVPPKPLRFTEPWHEARYVPPAPREPSSILLRHKKDDDEWERRELKHTEIDAGDTLVSLPGYRSDVRLDNGLLLTLWGDLPELSLVTPYLESMIELNPPGDVALDLRLDHGRLVVANERATQARIRVHFANPTTASGTDVWEVVLKGKNATMAIELWGRYPADVPFSLDKKKRLGPQTELYLLILKGQAEVTVDENTRTMEAPPVPATDGQLKPGIIIWTSKEGVTGPLKIPTLPDWALHRYPPFPEKLSKQQLDYYQGLRGAMVNALDELGTSMSGKKVESGLLDELKSKNPIRRALAVRCFGAINDLSNLLDGLVDPLFPEVRQAAIEALRHWSGRSKDNDLVLHDALIEKRYTKGEAGSIMRLLHRFSDSQMKDPELYSRLIDYLIQDKAAIRVLAHWHLSRLVPWGAKIKYDPMGESDVLEKGYDAWKRLVPDGALPKPPKAPVAPKAKKTGE
jgi:hypothetical protein